MCFVLFADCAAFIGARWAAHNGRGRHFTADTKFVRDGKAVALGDGAAGEEVAGYARNDSGGKAQALSVRFGSATATDPQKTPTRKAPKPQPSAAE